MRSWFNFSCANEVVAKLAGPPWLALGTVIFKSRRAFDTGKTTGTTTAETKEARLDWGAYNWALVERGDMTKYARPLAHWR
ncbi:MAG: hypothetical protein ACTSU5_04160, partial [Promethearchaeota archaeon]